MPEYVFGNFFATELTVGITVGATELQVPPSSTLLLPLFDTVDDKEARLTLWDGQLPPEVVGCTRNLQNGTLVIVRAKEGTTAQAWSAGAQVVSALTSEVINSALAAYFDFNEVLAASFLKLTGGVLTGPLLLHGPPLDPLGAATKLYVDSVQGSGLPLSGGVMQGDINMNSNRIINLPTPLTPSEPATKAYADALTTFPGQAIDDFEGSLVAGGTASAFTVLPNVPTPVYVHGQRLCVRFGVTNAAGATLNVNSLGPRPLQTYPGVAAPAGTLLPGVPTGMTYDSVAVAWVIAEARAMTAAELLLNVGTDYTAPLLTDRTGVWDTANSIGKSILLPNFLKIIGLLPNELPHPTQDLFAYYDAASGTVKQATSAQIASVAPPPVPKDTVLTAASGTFNITAGCRQIRGRAIAGGGGGGQGGGVDNATAGGTTTFGSISAGGGGPGHPSSAAAGVGGIGGTGGSGTAYLRQAGAIGMGYVATTNPPFIAGGHGAGSPFGSGGTSQANGNGSAGRPNTGTGGSGGGGGSGNHGGSGGGAGEYIEFVIDNPVGPYSWANGAGGTGGSGAGISTGGNGGSGIIIIQEIF